MNVRYTDTARLELEHIESYIASDNAAAARAVVRQIKHVINRIRDFPHIAYAVNETGIRIFPATPFPYLIFYTVGRREVIIRNVRYAARMRP